MSKVSLIHLMITTPSADPSTMAALLTEIAPVLPDTATAPRQYSPYRLV